MLRDPYADPESLLRHRRWMVLMSAAGFIIPATAFILAAGEFGDGLRRVEAVQAFGLGLWATALLIFVATGGFLAAPRRSRQVLQDEVAQAYSRTALMTGFWTMLAAAVAVIAGASFGLTALQGGLIVLVCGVLGASLRYAALLFDPNG